MNDTLKKLIEVLEKDERLIIDGRLAKNKVIELALQLDVDLLKLLRSSKDLKSTFFQQVDDMLVFDKVKFQSYISNKQFLPDSFTEYKNKIGLIADRQYLTDSEEVVLAFPYKDCVLEGGQTKEDSKRNEVFWNETLAPDEIDRLLKPKVLANFKKYDNLGKHKVSNLTFEDNLIIKGNNLLALHTLKERYAGKVKLIYVDPPFNTGSDSFAYNDKFNHSTWLTFMRNRLEIARQLLSDNGSIYVHLDWNEVHYLKVLMDGIFGRENFRNEIIWYYENKFKFQFTKNFNNDTEAILFYSKKEGQQYFKHIKVPVKESRKQNKVTWDKDLKKMVTVKDENGMVVYYDSEDKIVGTLWNIPRINSQSKERLDFTGQKPEELIQRIIEASTEEGDIVLDYHAGTGTTLATAHKMNRQYIGIEQMDYIHELPEKRLVDVINGDQTGISKSVHWKGGGSFVYAELSRANQLFVDKIQGSKSRGDLLKLWDEMKKMAFLSYRIRAQDIDSTTKDFEKLSLEDQQKLLISILDKNLLYIPYLEIDDKSYNTSEDDKKLNDQFYNGK